MKWVEQKRRGERHNPDAPVVWRTAIGSIWQYDIYASDRAPGFPECWHVGRKRLDGRKWREVVNSIWDVSREVQSLDNALAVAELWEAESQVAV